MTGRWLRGWMARRNAPDTPWRECEFVVLDFETTGLNARRADPLSVGWVLVRDGRLVLGSVGYSLIHYDGPLPADAASVHGLLLADVARAPRPADVGRRLTEVLDGRVLVAHGLWMEQAMLGRCGVRVPDRTLDTMRLARAVDRLEGNRHAHYQDLSGLASRLGLPVHRPHHAFGDALTTGAVFLSLATVLERRHAGGLRSLMRLSRRG